MPEDAAGSRSLRPAFSAKVFVIATVIAVLGGFGGYAGNRNVSPTYRSQGAVSFDQTAKLSKSTDAGIIEKLSRMRALYGGLAETDVVVDAVAKQVKLSRGDVQDDTFTAADPASLLLVVGADGSSAISARRLATAFANQLVVTATTVQEKAKVPAEDRILVTVSIAPGPAELIAPTTRKSVTIGVVCAVVLFVAVVGLAGFLRRSKR